MTITLDQLNRIMPAAAGRTVLFQPWLEQFMPAYGIEGVLREAAFLATIAVESGELKYTRELWGPTPQQEGYEGRADLGNTQPGDGSLYRGRGLIQITGRFGYTQAAKALGVDYVGNPTLMQSPEEATRTACWWWQEHGCNALSDVPDFKAVTRRVNGGLTAYEQRKGYYDMARGIL